MSGGKNLVHRFPPEPLWQEGAGGLLLVVAAHETGLLSSLEAAMVASLEVAALRLTFPAVLPRRRLLLTLLFLNAVGPHRTSDLRSYTGEALGLLSGRPRAYSY